MMKRRDFTLAALAGATALPALAQLRFESGQDYQPLPKPVPVETPTGQIEVVEFFAYACPHCNAFEPSLEAWIQHKSKDVTLRRVPVPFVGAQPQVRQRLFYTLEAMNLLDKMHTKVFHAIHVEGQRMEDPAAIANWIATQGVDKGKFLEQFNSFSIASKVTRANQLVDAYKVSGVPSFGVAGRFYADTPRALQVVDYLVGEVRKGR